MQNLLSSLHVRTRLFLLILMVFVGIVAVTSASLWSMRSAMMSERQAKITGIVESATNVVAHYYQLQQEGKLTEEQAKKEATNVLRHAKFEKTNYVFIYDTDFIRVMLPPAPDTEGKSFKDLKDTNGKYLLQDMVNIALGKGSGFTSYWFPRPDQKEAAPKLGYVQYFPQWKWVIGTGVYVDDVDAAFWSVAWTNIGIGVFLLVCVGAFSMLISQGILRQLGGEPAYALQVVHQVAEGDLTARTHLRPDDHDSLLAQMQAMIGHLGSLIRQVRDSSEAIDTAAKEIAQGNMDLSNRTESQSANLEVTAASMEELTSTVKNNSDNARQANALAKNASEVAQRGGAVVGDVVKTMESIKESSGKIVDIISVIDGIAFQTNILALNAAVEAARAGEQGRGFAVVASEVRTLAQRSAAAAKEIKQLINDSVDTVNAGTSLVDAAGQTMQEIMVSIGQVTTIMDEIARASTEQSQGIDSVNTSIVEMEAVTQQNAALVEQAAAAAQSMQDQSSRLLAEVSTFKV